MKVKVYPRLGSGQKYHHTIYPVKQVKLNQNALIERFNRTYRTEELGAYLFTNLEQIQIITDQWLFDYNEYRPYETLGNIPPVQFMPRLTRVPNLYRILSI